MRLVQAVARIAALCLLLTACGAEAPPQTRSFTALDTLCTVKLYGDAPQELLQTAVDTVNTYERLWSRTVADSDVARLNAAGGEAVVLATDTSALLQTARTWSARTDGAFDVTIAPYKALWEAATEAPPSAQALAEAGARVGATHLQQDPWRLTNGAAVDLGAIAKGAIADKVCDALKAAGCTSALIDLGGNMTALGAKPDGTPFHIAIADPRDPSAMLLTVEAADVTLSTSGSYERYYELGGVRYSHILDPQTGRSVDNDLLSVTVIAARGIDADALSTACFVMGFERARAFLDTLDGVEAVFVRTDGTAVLTDGVRTV